MKKNKKDSSRKNSPAKVTNNKDLQPVGGSSRKKKGSSPAKDDQVDQNGKDKSLPFFMVKDDGKSRTVTPSKNTDASQLKVDLKKIEPSDPTAEAPKESNRSATKERSLDDEGSLGEPQPWNTNDQKADLQKQMSQTAKPNGTSPKHKIGQKSVEVNANANFQLLDRMPSITDIDEINVKHGGGLNRMTPETLESAKIRSNMVNQQVPLATNTQSIFEQQPPSCEVTVADATQRQKEESVDTDKHDEVLRRVETSSVCSEEPQDPDKSIVGRTLFEEDFFGGQNIRDSYKNFKKKKSQLLHDNPNKQQMERYTKRIAPLFQGQMSEKTFNLPSTLSFTKGKNENDFTKDKSSALRFYGDPRPLHNTIRKRSVLQSGVQGSQSLQKLPSLNLSMHKKLNSRQLSPEQLNKLTQNYYRDMFNERSQEDSSSLNQSYQLNTLQDSADRSLQYDRPNATYVQSAMQPSTSELTGSPSGKFKSLFTYNKAFGPGIASSKLSHHESLKRLGIDLKKAKNSRNFALLAVGPTDSDESEDGLQSLAPSREMPSLNLSKKKSKQLSLTCESLDHDHKHDDPEAESLKKLQAGKKKKLYKHLQSALARADNQIDEAIFNDMTLRQLETLEHKAAQRGISIETALQKMKKKVPNVKGVVDDDTINSLRPFKEGKLVMSLKSLKSFQDFKVKRHLVEQQRIKRERRLQMNNKERAQTIHDLEQFDRRQESHRRFNNYDDDEASLNYVDAQVSADDPSFSAPKRNTHRNGQQLRTITQLERIRGQEYPAVFESTTYKLPMLTDKAENMRQAFNQSAQDNIRISQNNSLVESSKAPERQTFGPAAMQKAARETSNSDFNSRNETSEFYRKSRKYEICARLDQLRAEDEQKRQQQSSLNNYLRLYARTKLEKEIAKPSPRFTTEDLQQSPAQKTSGRDKRTKVLIRQDARSIDSDDIQKINLKNATEISMHDTLWKEDSIYGGVQTGLKKSKSAMNIGGQMSRGVNTPKIEQRKEALPDLIKKREEIKMQMRKDYGRNMPGSPQRLLGLNGSQKRIEAIVNDQKIVKQIELKMKQDLDLYEMEQNRQMRQTAAGQKAYSRIDSISRLLKFIEQYRAVEQTQANTAQLSGNRSRKTSIKK